MKTITKGLLPSQFQNSLRWTVLKFIKNVNLSFGHLQLTLIVVLLNSFFASTQCTTPPAPSASGVTVDCGTPAIFTASGTPTGGSYVWYSNAAGTNQVGTGSTFTTPALNANTTYYVASSVSGGTPSCNTNTLANILSGLNTNQSTISSTVTNGYNFTMDAGVNSNYISDGGNDMYDVGNYISTNFTTNIPYSDGVIASSGAFGTGSSYFTRKINNMWVLTANLNNVSTFTTNGNNGADGGGLVNGTSLSITVGCQQYTLFLKRIWNAGDPSINQMVIIPTTSGVNHTWSTNTNDGFHQITGLNSVTRMYYLLYASAGGSYLDDNTAINIATTFLTQVSATISVPNVCLSSLTPVTANVNQASNPSVTGATVNCGQPATLTASSNASINWYSNSTATILAGTGTSFTTPVLNATTIYYVQAGTGACVSGIVPATATVVSSIPAPSVSPVTINCAQSTTLTATGSPSSYAWYADPNGNTLLGTGATFTTPTLSTSTTYYVASGTVTNAQPITFNYTGSIQNYTVPAGVTQISIDARGAGGGSGTGGTGGAGGRMQATIPVTPGQTLKIVVGGAGGPSSGRAGAGGGGFSGVLDASNAHLVTAGGGGGTTGNEGCPSIGNGGNGGATSGTSGSCGVGGAAGVNGANPAGGIGGTGAFSGQPGTSAGGGVGGATTGDAGTGGGGGGFGVTGAAAMTGSCTYTSGAGGFGGGGSGGTGGCGSTIARLSGGGGGGGGYTGGAGGTSTTGCTTCGGGGGGGGSNYVIGGASLVTSTSGSGANAQTNGLVIITPINQSCTSALVPVTVTVAPTTNPVVSNATIDCGQTATLNASSNATINWYSNSSATTLIATGNTYTTPFIPTTTTYYLQAGSGVCASSIVPVTVTVVSTVANPTASGTTVNCGQTATLTATGAPTGGSYIWYSNAAGTNQVGVGANFTTPALGAASTYYVSATSSSPNTTYSYTAPIQINNTNGGDLIFTVPGVPTNPSGSATLTVYAMGDIDINPSELVTVVSETGNLGTFNGPQCGASFTSATYTIPLNTLNTWVANGSISLTLDGGVDVSASLCSTGGTHSIRGYFTISYPYSTNVCQSGLVPVNVNVNQATNPVSSNATVNCLQTASLSASSNSPINWFSNSAATTQIGTGNSYTTPSLSGTTTYYIQAGIGSCASSILPVTVTVNQATTPSANNATINCLQTASLSATSNTPINWYTNSNATGLLVTSSTYTTPVLSGSTTYYIQAGTGSCASTIVPVAVTVNQAVTPTVNNPTVNCGQTAALTATSNTSINWYSNSNATGLLGTGSSYTTTSLTSTTSYYIQAGTGSCASSIVTATVSVNNANAPVISNPTINCGQATTLTSSSNATIYWYLNSNATGLLGTGTSFTTPALATTTSYYAQAGTGSCASSIVPVTVTVNPVSAPSISGTTQLCGSGTTTLTATGSGNTIEWYADPAGTQLISTGSSLVTPVLNSNTTYYVRENSTISGSQTFNFSGAVQTWTVPSNVFSINVQAWGAQGGTYIGVGGKGGLAQGTVAVTPGQTINIYVGGQGSSVPTSGTQVAGGWNGGGFTYNYSTYYATSGGGASDIRIGGTALSNRILVAGGGGGGAYFSGASNGGAGGGTNGTQGAAAPGYSQYTGGGGGTQSAGGTQGGSSSYSQAGSLGQGGNSTGSSGGWNGCGGGGGYYGGGSGGALGAGGGGGSSFIGGVTNGSTTADVRSGNGQVIISWSTPACASPLVPVTVAVNSLPTVTASASSIAVCSGQQVTLSGNGASSYSWNNNVSNTVPFAPTTTTTYTVVGTDMNNCSNSANITVSVNPLPTVTGIASQNTLCLGESVTLTGAGASTYTWNNNVTDGVSFIPSSTQIYTVTGTDANNCANTANVTVNVNSIVTQSIIGTGDFVWRGSTSSDYTTVSNWLQHNGTSLVAATVAPTASTNVIIPTNQTCVLNQPNTNANIGNANSLRIENGATLTMGSGNLNVAGNWVNNGSFVPGTGTVTFAGSGTHSISGSSANHNFNNLTMNKSGEIILSVPVTITGSLALTNGRLNIVDFNLDLSTNTINGGNANSYVKTSGTGVLMRNVGASTVNFPVGRGAYNPAALTNSGVADKFSIRVIDNVTDNGDNADTDPTTTMAVVNRTWMIDEQTAGGSNVTLRLDWNGAGEEINGFQGINAFIAHYMTADGLWDNIGGTTPSLNVIETGGITSFSPFTISSDTEFAPLPVELMSFSSSCENEDVAIMWTTASENNSMHFEVEVSQDAMNWEVLSIVQAAQFSTSLINYAIKHEGGAREKNYYRLKQVDQNGDFKVYNVIYADCGGTAGTPSTFPNPSRGDFAIDLNGADVKGTVQMVVLNSEGKEISSRQLDLGEGVAVLQITNMDLQPGVYYLKMIDETGRSFIIKHCFM